MVGVLFAGGDNPQTRANLFMAALARGDAKALAESTAVKGKTEKELEEYWKKSVESSKFYRFKYKLLGVQATGESAIVRMYVWRDVSGAGYEESFQLDMIQVDGKWKVRGNGISREMYPFLPRFD